MIRPVPHVGAITPYTPAPVPDGDVLSLARTDSAFPVSPAAVAAGCDALAAAARYPDPDWCDLRAALADAHGLDRETILCGAGMTELIGALIALVAGPGDAVLGSQFGNRFLANACARSQADYEMAHETMMGLSVDTVAALVTPRTRVVVLSNPGRVTGAMIVNSKIEWLRAVLPDDVLLVVDQAFGEFGDAAQDPGALFALAQRGNTVILRSLSHAYGLAGARVGWGCFPAALVPEMRKLLNPGSVSAISQAMAAAAVRDRAHMAEVVAQTGRNKIQFVNDLGQLGIEVPPSYGNFVLLRFPSADRALQAERALRRAGMAMRGMGDYGLADCLRATIGEAPVMARVVEVLDGLPP